MQCKPIPKPAYKSRNRKTVHDFSQKVKQAEYEDAKGICRICQSKPITQYHHANEKGMGGGRGLGIQINCIGLCDTCHNHDIPENLKKASEILRQRIDKIAPTDGPYFIWSLRSALDMSQDEVFRQMSKGFLKHEYLDTDTERAMATAITTKEDICRWLGMV
jgi:hypothetical protein